MPRPPSRALPRATWRRSTSNSRTEPIFTTEPRLVYRSRAEVPDLRIAAFVLAIQKVARFYVEFGL